MLRLAQACQTRLQRLFDQAVHLFVERREALPIADRIARLRVRHRCRQWTGQRHGRQRR